MGSSYALAALGYKIGKRAMIAGFMLSSVAAYQAAVSPLAWVMPVEILPQDMRMRGNASVGMFSTVFSVLILQCHPLLAQGGVLAVLGTYTATTGLGLVLNHTLIPETLGRSLEDIERDWRSRRPSMMSRD